MAGTYVVTANNMLIDTAGGFGGNNYVPTVTCSGTCAAGTGGYSANVGGSFAGVAAASAGLGYDIWPTVGAGLPVSNLVQGMVAFSTATPPSRRPCRSLQPQPHRRGDGGRPVRVQLILYVGGHAGKTSRSDVRHGRGRGRINKRRAVIHDSSAISAGGSPICRPWQR